MKQLLTTILILIAAFQGYSQDYVFRVMLNKGSNTYGSASSWEKLVTGTKLTDKQTLKLGDDSYIALLHSSGVTMELKESGEYKVSDLNSKISNNQSSLLQKYSQYIMDNISEEDQSRLNATGAVKRSIYDIDVYLNEYGEYYSNMQIFDWDDIEGVDSYIVTIRDKFDEEIFKKEVSRSEIAVDFSNPKLRSQELVVVYFDIKGEENTNSDGFGLKPINDERLTVLQTELESLKSEFKGETALKNLVIASYYEENGLYTDAITCYRKAMALSDDVDGMYEDFLIRNGFKDKTN